MDWIFQHLWVVVVIAGLVAKVLQAAKGRSGGADGQPPAPPKEFEFGDPDLAERTRKIREEIRRKIEERRGQPASPATPTALPPSAAPVQWSSEEASPPPVATLPEVVREVMQRRDERASQPGAEIRFEEEREALAGQLRVAAEMKSSVERRVTFEQSIEDKAPAALAAGRVALQEDLRSPAALRRAIILREVLGPPLALR